MKNPNDSPSPLLGAWILLLAVAALLVTSTPARAAEVESLSDAMAKGRIRFDAVAMHGFEKIDITIVNLVSRILKIDPAGAVLIPPDPALQRLGLGAPVGADPADEGSFFIHLAPNGQWSGTVWAVCLDHGKGVPSNGVPYTLSKKSAEGKALEVLKYWARNPWIQQKTVNDLIWTGQDIKVLRSQVIPSWLRKSSLAAWGGEIMWLSGTGRLFRRTPDAWANIGKRLEKVILGHGLVVGTHNSINGIRYKSLTGEGWSYKSLAGVPSQVHPAPGFLLYTLVESSLFLLEPGKPDFAKASDLECEGVAMTWRAKTPVLFLLERETAKIHTTDPRDGKWITLPAGPAKKIAASRESLYAEFETGVFRYGRGWAKVAETGTAFFPASKSCFLVRGDSVSVFHEAKGKTSPLPPLKSSPLFCSVDPVEEKVYIIDERGAIWSFVENEWKFLFKIPAKNE
ncbi:MAG: hypothetical protein ACYTFG_02170 [Planctomycetota bacterium]|jgi:hypothetical protein